MLVEAPRSRRNEVFDTQFIQISRLSARTYAYRIAICRTMLRFLRNVLDRWLEVDAFGLAAALAYYAIFSIAPLLLLSSIWPLCFSIAHCCRGANQ